MQFHEVLKQLRTSCSISQPDLVKSIGMSLRGYQYIESGEKQPTLSNILALADYFNVSLDYLVGRSDNKEVIKRLATYKSKLDEIQSKE